MRTFRASCARGAQQLGAAGKGATFPCVVRFGRIRRSLACLRVPRRLVSSTSGLQESRRRAGPTHVSCGRKKFTRTTPQSCGHLAACRARRQGDSPECARAKQHSDPDCCRIRAATAATLTWSRQIEAPDEPKATTNKHTRQARPCSTFNCGHRSRASERPPERD